MIAQKATLATISEFAKAYAVASKSGNTTFSLTKNELCGAVDKIGEMITLKGSYDDDLTFMDGAELPLGLRTFNAWAHRRREFQGAGTRGAL